MGPTDPYKCVRALRELLKLKPDGPSSDFQSVKALYQTLNKAEPNEVRVAFPIFESKALRSTRGRMKLRFCGSGVPLADTQALTRAFSKAGLYFTAEREPAGPLERIVSEAISSLEATYR